MTHVRRKIPRACRRLSQERRLILGVLRRGWRGPYFRPLEALSNRGTGLMVGVSVDWSIMYPEYSNYVLASAAMRSDRWIEDTILQVLDGTFQAGNDTADLASGYVDCVYGAVWADRIPVSLKAELDTLRADLISGRRSAKRP